MVRRPRNSLEKINKSLDSREHRLKTAIVDKKEALRNFEKRAKAILADHQKIKEKVEGWGQVDGDVFQEFKSSVNSSFHEFKKVFTEMEAAEKQLDRKFFEEIKEHFDAIIKEAVNHSPSKLIEKEKNRVNILKSLNIDAEIILILKEDTRY